MMMLMMMMMVVTMMMMMMAFGGDPGGGLQNPPLALHRQILQAVAVANDTLNIVEPL